MCFSALQRLFIAFIFVSVVSPLVFATSKQLPEDSDGEIVCLRDGNVCKSKLLFYLSEPRAPHGLSNLVEYPSALLAEKIRLQEMQVLLTKHRLHDLKNPLLLLIGSMVFGYLIQGYGFNLDLLDCVMVQRCMAFSCFILLVLGINYCVELDQIPLIDHSRLMVHKGSMNGLYYLLEQYNSDAVQNIIPISLKSEFEKIHKIYRNEFDGSDEEKQAMNSFLYIILPLIEKNLSFIEYKQTGKELAFFRVVAE